MTAKLTKEIRTLIKKLGESKGITGCNYGDHNMEYVWENGKCLSSECKSCGAFYYGFHL